jgi:hypothetical protein
MRESTGRLACFEQALRSTRDAPADSHDSHREQDTQIAERRKVRDEFVNTRSADAFIEDPTT